MRGSIFTSTTRRSRFEVVAVALASALGGSMLAAVIQATTGVFSYSVGLLPVVLSAWFAGTYAAMLTIVLNTVFALVLDGPFWGPRVVSSDDQLRLIMQVVMSLIVGAVVVRLRNVEQRNRLIVENAAEGIWLIDADGLTTFVNKRLADLLGYTPAQLFGRRFTDFVPASALAEAEQGFATRKRGLPEFGECELLRKDGSSVWTMFAGAPLYDGGRFIGALAMLADITDRKRTEALLHAQSEQLREADRLKDEFLATLSHELRTPLNAILGWSDMAVRMSLDADGQRKAFERIRRAALAETELVQDILDMSRIISGKLRLKLQTVDLAAVVEAAAEVVRPAADAKRIGISLDLDRPCQLVGDPDRLQQVAWNLLSNSVKFTPREGHIDVRVRGVNSQLELKVRDTGIGIPAGFLPHVFERFRQQDSATTRSHGGLGLGLAIVRHVVELHGGSVRVDSDGEGRGATFTVALPVSAVMTPEPRGETPLGEIGEPRAPAAIGSLTGLRVLVVDDNEDALTLVQAVLDGAGAEVRVTQSAADALSVMERERFDVLVADIGMPQVDGIELISRVRSLPAARGGALPAIALTAYGRDEDRTRALRAGFQHHLTKPAAADELVALVAATAGEWKDSESRSAPTR